MLYDCFSFFNELDTLEIRLNTLKDVVDRFVLVEASWTHTGHAKSYIFEENKERFRPFLDRIIHIKLTEADLPPIPLDKPVLHQSWIRENTQRNAIAKGLWDAKPEDVIIISDLDEIPSPEAVRSSLADTTGITSIHIRNYSFWLNNANISAPWHYRGPRVLTVKTFRDPTTYKGMNGNSCAPLEANPLPSATFIRFTSGSRAIYGGWHFSSQGGAAGVQIKINNIAESSLVDQSFFNNEQKIEKTIRSGRALTAGVPYRLMPEPLSHNFPPFIVSNQSRFADQLLPATETFWQEKRMTRCWARFQLILHDRIIGLLIKAVPKTIHPFCRRIRRAFNF